MGKIPQPGQARIAEALGRNELQNLTSRIGEALAFNELQAPGQARLYIALYTALYRRGVRYIFIVAFSFLAVQTIVQATG